MQWLLPYGDRLHSPRGQYTYVGIYRAGNVYFARNETSSVCRRMGYCNRGGNKYLKPLSQKATIVVHL